MAIWSDALTDAIKLVEDHLGKDAAKKYPDIVAALVNTYHHDDVVSMLARIAENVRSDHPFMGSTFDVSEIASALHAVADAIASEKT